MVSAIYFITFVVSLLYLVVKLRKVPAATTLKRQRRTRSRLISYHIGKSLFLWWGLMFVAGIARRIVLGLPL